jgi:hypothetical protein
MAVYLSHFMGGSVLTRHFPRKIPFCLQQNHCLWLETEQMLVVMLGLIVEVLLAVVNDYFSLCSC